MRRKLIARSPGRLLSGLVFLLSSVALGLTQAPAAQAAGGSGTLTIGVTQFPSTLHPNIDSMLAKNYVQAMTLRPLTHYDQDWEVICFLCTEVPSLEAGTAELETTPDGDEGIAVTYSLHPDATWGDGTPVTTDDVLFTWEVGRHPQSGISNFELYRRILDITVIDDKTFTFHVDRVTFAYASATDFRVLPAHIERPIFEADPASYRTRTAFDSDPTNPGLAFGPYRIVSLTPGAEVALEPNDTWFGPPPAFDRIVVRVIENTPALEANLLSGAIDTIPGAMGLTVDQALAFEQRHGDDWNVLFKPGLVYEHIDLMLDNPILADRRLRQALLHGIDRDAISEQLFAGRNPVADGNVSPLDWVYSDAIPTYPYDPERAEALLEEAGWTRQGGSGLRRNAAGDSLRLEIMTTAGDRTRELVQQVIQSQLRDIGVELTIRNEPARVFFGQTVSQRRFTGLAMFAWFSSPENVPRTTLHCEQIPTEENGWGGQNYTGYCTPEMDALIDRIEIELDREARAELWAELQRLYATDLPALPLYWRAQPFVLPPWLEGVRPTGHMGTTTLWVEEWRRAE
ncbi:peptide ABC transporter substrate-binding protein [Algihabitans albus]|uniref:peptide ABC transporter substrate-binding protein n=1 Tax=Algihabitans albus TaxID=2164067 RepID=UPI0035D000E7